MAGMKFKEIQRFNQRWIWIIIIITGLLIYYSTIKQLIFKGNSAIITIPNFVYITIFVLHLLITILLLLTKLEIEISTRYISYRFFPFHLKKKKVPISLIQSAFIREYHPFKEVSALGINLGKHSKVYNIKGKWGLQLEFQEGRHLLLGTQKPEEILKMLKYLQIPEE